MNSSAEAADEVVKMYLQGVEVVAKITGTGAKHIAAMIYAMAKDQNQTNGKTKLKNMLKSNSKLKVFSIRQQDLKTFSKEAKRYGVLYCFLTSKFGSKDSNKMIDIMVREEDAARINRIVEKFKLSTYDKASVQSEVERDRDFNNAVEADNAIKDKKIGQKAGEYQLNPNLAKTEKSPLSEHSLKNRKSLLEGSNYEKNRPSVKKELEKIRKEQNQNSGLDNVNSKSKNTKHSQPKHNKKKKKFRGR